MDSKGRPTAADIDDKTFLRYAQGIQLLGRGTSSLVVDCFPLKVRQAKAAKLAKRGLLEVTADNFPRWVTEKGEELLVAPASSCP